MVGFRHTEHLADHGHRQRERQRLDQVGPAVGRHRVEEAVDRRRDPRAHVLHGSGRERLAHDPPEPGVVGRVGEEHHPFEQRLQVGQPDLAGELHELLVAGLVTGVAAESGVAQDGEGVCVPGDDQRPEDGRDEPSHLPDPGVGRVGVGPDGRITHELDDRDGLGVRHVPVIVHRRRLRRKMNDVTRRQVTRRQLSRGKPKSWRATTSRCTCWVPSPMSRIFTSR